MGPRFVTVGISILLIGTLLAACAAPHHSLADLAAHQEAYAGKVVSTSGTVRGFDDASGTYYVLEDDQGNRVEVTPAERVASLVGRTVSVTGRFRVDPAQGRVIAIDTLEASAS